MNNEQDELDRRDGEALRLLREACSPGDFISLFELQSGPAIEVRDSRNRFRVQGYGGRMTLAEAADACRAALAPDGARVTAP